MSTPTDYEREPATRLMVYMTGYRTGAAGSAWKPSQMENEDFKRGHDDGRRDKQAAYQAACDHYGAMLSPLRGRAAEAMARETSLAS